MWTQQPTLETIEHLLDTNQLQVAMANGNWWTIRRNGRTKLWKRGGRARIPYKMGLYGYGALEFWDNQLLNFTGYRVADQ